MVSGSLGTETIFQVVANDELGGWSGFRVSEGEFDGRVW
jgi:hypothetical protein